MNPLRLFLSLAAVLMLSAANAQSLKYYGYYYSGQIAYLSEPATGIDFDYATEVVDHANLAFASSNGSYYANTNDPVAAAAARDRYIRNVVRFVSTVAARPVGTGAARMKTVLEVGPIFFKSSGNTNATAANVNPNRVSDWSLLVNSLNAANQLDNVAAFYLVDEPDGGADTNTVCSAASTIRSYQAGRTIPVATIFFNLSHSSMPCYDWVGYDSYKTPSVAFFGNDPTCLVLFPPSQQTACQRVLGNRVRQLRANLRSDQKIILVPGANGPANGSGTVGFQDPKIMFNGAVDVNNESGAKVVAIIPYLWKIGTDSRGLAFDTGSYYKPTWNQVGRKILSGDMVKLP